MRIVDPVAVISWFRPPIDQGIPANDLEIYTTRVDAYGLLTLAALLVALSDAVPLPNSMTGSAFVAPVSDRSKKPYGRVIVLLTMVHHILTGVGSFDHWRKPTHHTLAMDIGVYGNIGLTALGAVALAFGFEEDEKNSRAVRKAKEVK